MMANDPIYDVNVWRRLGRGQVLQFFATDEEIQNWLLTTLPQEYSPYKLVGTDSIKQGKKQVQIPFEFDISELKKAMYENESTRWDFWIISKTITPELNFSKEKMISWVLSFTGLVNLQHGGYIKNMGRAASSIGIVDKVINDETGKVVKHKNYLKIFNVLKKEIQKHLCFSSMWIAKDGSKYEDKKLQLMTEAVVKEYEQGKRFKNIPGNRIK